MALVIAYHALYQRLSLIGCHRLLQSSLKGRCSSCFALRLLALLRFLFKSPAPMRFVLFDHGSEARKHKLYGVLWGGEGPLTLMTHAVCMDGSVFVKSFFIALISLAHVRILFAIHVEGMRVLLLAIVMAWFARGHGASGVIRNNITYQPFAKNHQADVNRDSLGYGRCDPM